MHADARRHETKNLDAKARRRKEEQEENIAKESIRIL
jgi:hypothetical protein